MNYIILIFGILVYLFFAYRFYVVFREIVKENNISKRTPYTVADRCLNITLSLVPVVNLLMFLVILFTSKKEAKW